MTQFLRHGSVEATPVGARAGAGRLAALAPLVAVVALSALGCFDPQITSGNLKCAPPDNACPDGFTCVGGVCVSRIDASVDATDAATMDGAPIDAACANAVAPLCASGPAVSAVCDPVCQTGCGCGLRCGVSTTGPTCSAQVGAKTLGQLCTPTTDDCAPGLACLREACGRNLARCYRFCRDASVCGTNGACTIQVNSSSDVALGQLVCDLAEQTCDPIAGTGCPDAALSCFVTSVGQTICDCPGRARGEGESCGSYADCAPGLACLQSRCVRLCRSTTDCANCTVLGVIRYCPIGAAD
jgi:hypothetical protein